MRRWISIFLAVILSTASLLSAFQYASAAGPPQTFGYQGTLTSSGSAVTGTKSITVRIFDRLSGGTLLYTEAHPSVTVDSGFFSITIGDTTALSGITFNQALFLELVVEGTTMSPRQIVNTVPYANVAYGALATSTAPTTTTGGLLYYDTTDGNLFVFDHLSSTWVDLTSTTADTFTTFNGVGIRSVTNNQNLLLGASATTTSSKLEVAGNTSLLGTLAVTGAGTSTFANGLNLSAGCFAISSTCVLAAGGSATFTELLLTGSSTLQSFTAVNSTTTNATTTNLVVSGAASTTALTTGTLAVVGSATSTFANGLDLAAGCFAVNSVCVVSATGAGSFTTLSVSGLTTLADLLVNGSTTLQNFTSVNSTSSNATTTGIFAVSGVATTTDLQAGRLTVTGSATSSFGNGLNLSAGCFAINNVCVGNGGIGSFTTLTASGLTTLADLLVNGSTTLQNFTFVNATGTRATTTNLFTATLVALNSSFTNLIATSTFQASSTALFGQGLTAFASSTFQAFTGTNATTTNATTTNFAVSGTASTTILTTGTLTASGLTTLADLLVNGSTTLQNFTSVNSTSSNATTTGIFAVSGVATTTDLQAGRLTVTGSATSSFGNGLNLSAGCFAIANVCVGNGGIGSFTTLTASGLTTLADLLVNGSTTLQNFTFVNATGTRATTTNLFTATLVALNSSFTNLIATSTFQASSTALFGQGLTAFASSTFQSFTGTNATTTNATTTGIFAVTGVATTTDLQAGRLTVTGSATSSFVNGLNLSSGCFAINNVCVGNGGVGSFTTLTASSLTTLADLLVTGSTTLQNFTAVNSTSSNATTTGNLAVSGIATTTDLRAGRLTVTGSATSTAANGFDLASGCFAVNSVCLVSNLFGAAVDLASAEVAGILPIANGGTNTTELQRSLLWFDGTRIAATSSQVTVGSLIATSSALSLFNGPLGASSTALFTEGFTVYASSTLQNFTAYKSTTTAASTTVFAVVGLTGTSTVAADFWVKGTLRAGQNSMFLNDDGLRDGGGAFFLGSAATSTFSTTNGGLAVGTNKLVVEQSSGHVGINTATPGSAFVFDVNGDTRITGTLRPSTINIPGIACSGAGKALASNGSDDVVCVTVSAGGTFILTDNNWNYDIAGDYYFTATTTSRVAIGANAPVRDTILTVTSNNGASTTLALVPASGASQTADILAVQPGPGNFATSTLLTNTQRLGLGLGSGFSRPTAKLSVRAVDSSGSAESTAFNVISSSNLEIFTIKEATGNVGVGDSAPGAMFTVGSGGLFRVSSGGAITALTGLTTTGGYTQSGADANTFTGATGFSGVVTLSSPGTALVVNNNATVGGIATAVNFSAVASSTFQNFTSVNSTSSNATTTGIFAVTGIATTTDLQAGRLTVTGSATSSFGNGLNLSAGCFAINNVCVGNGGIGSFTTLTASGLTTLADLLVNGSTTLQNFTFVNATGTRATTTNLFTATLVALNSSFTNLIATSTFQASSTALFGQGLTAFASSTFQSFTGTNATTTNATTTGIFAVTGVATTTDLQAGRLTVTGSATSSFGNGLNLSAGCFAIANVCVGNGGIGSFTTLTASGLTTLADLLVNGSTTLQNFTSVNSTSSNATTTGIFAVTGIATTTDLQAGRLTVTGSATSSFGNGLNLSAGCFAINNVCVGNGGIGSFTTLTASGLTTLADLLVNGSTTLQNFTFVNATGTRATTTNLFTATLVALNSSFTNLIATSTFQASSTALFGQGLTAFASSTFQAFTGTNATTTNATTTNFAVSGTASTTILTTGTLTASGLTTLADLLVNGSTTLQNFTSVNSTSSNATTTGIFAVSGVATTTDLQAGRLTVTGSATSSFGNGLNLSAGCFAINNVCVGNGGIGSFTTLTASGLTTLADLLVNGSTTLQNFTFVNATGTRATTTNLFTATLVALNSSFTNLIATSTFQASSTALFGQGLTAFASSTFQSFTGTNATTTNATTTGIFAVTGVATTTDLQAGRLTVTGSATSSFVNGLNLSSGCFAVNNTCLSNNLTSFDFVQETNFGALALRPSTTISLWAKNGLFASSTSRFEGLATFDSGTLALASSTFQNATSTSFGVRNQLTVQGTGTSTFAGNVQVDGNLKVGTGSITLVGNSTSTFSSGGINLTNGCFAISGECVGSNASVSGFTDNGSTVTLTTITDFVGIGDADPVAQLTVGASDAFQVDSTGRVFANVGASGAGNLSYSFVGDTDTGFYRSADDETRLQTGGSDRLTVTSGGNVGIGDTTPASALTVGSGDLFQVNSSGNIVAIGGAGHSISNSSGALGIDSASTGAINVGTAAAAKTITVGNSSGATALNFTSGSGLQTFASSALTTDAFSFLANGLTSSNAFAITANGLTSGAGFVVVSSATALIGDLGKIEATGSNAGITGNALKVGLTGASAAGTALNVTNAGTGFTVRINDNGSYTDTTPVVVDASGNLGVGDASPTSLLTVGASDAFQVDSTGRVFANVGASGAGALAYSFVGDTDTGLYRSAANEMRFQTSGADRVTILSGGGVTIPSKALLLGDTDGSSGFPQIGVNNTSITMFSGGSPVSPTLSLDNPGTAAVGMYTGLKLSSGAGKLGSFIANKVTATANSSSNKLMFFTNAGAGWTGDTDAALVLSGTGATSLMTGLGDASFGNGDNDITFNTGSDDNLLLLNLASAAPLNILCYNTSSGRVSSGATNTCTTSDSRLKHDISYIATSSLSIIRQLRPANFELNSATGTLRAGFIAQDLLSLIPEAIGTSSEGFYSFDNTAVLAYAVKALQEVATTTAFLLNNWATTTAPLITAGEDGSLTFGTSSIPSLFIGSDGNLAIGTTSDPIYKLKVGGDIAATGFVNVSTESSKTNIEHLTSQDESTILDKIEGLQVATYHYKDEDPENPTRLGLIAEEAPTDVLSVDGKGVDIYKLATFGIAGIKAQQKELTDIRSQLAGLGATGSSSLSTEALLDALRAGGITVVNGTLTAEELGAKKLCLEDICIGKDELRSLLEKNSIAPLAPGGASGSASGTTPLDESSTTPSASDTEAPVITVTGNNPATITVGSSYIDLGATVTDNVDTNLGIAVTGDTIDTSTTTTYTVRYNAIDSAGNHATEMTRTVIVTFGE